MRHPTLNRVRYLLKGPRWWLLYSGELHHIFHRPPTICSCMMLYYLQCNIRIFRPLFSSPSGQDSGHWVWSTGGEISMDLWDHTSHDNFSSLDLHSSDDHTVPYQDPPVWCDLQREITQWSREMGLIVWPNIGLCVQECHWEDWQITET